MWCQGAYTSYGVMMMVRDRLSRMWERLQEWAVPTSAFRAPGFVRERCPCGAWRCECFHDVVQMPGSDQLADIPQ